MTCLSCQSVKQAELMAEMLVHFPGLKHLDKPGVLLFPKLIVCLDCGFARFTVPENELESVAKVILINQFSGLEEGVGDIVFGAGNAP